MTTTNEPKAIGRDALLSRVDRRHTTVDIPGGGTVRLQSLTEGEKAKYETSMLTKKGRVNQTKMEDATCRLIVLCMVDDEGRRILSDSDTWELLKLDGAVTAAIFDVATTHCGFSAEDIDAIVKNSGTLHADDSP